MIYKVLSDNHAYVQIMDADILQSIEENNFRRCEIIMAMGMSHKSEYLPYLYLSLNDDRTFIRRQAAQSIFLIDGMQGLEKLKERENQLDNSDFERLPSEKAFLQALIIRIESGTKGVLEYFCSDQGIEIVKCMLLSYYVKRYNYKEEDIEVIVKILNIYIEKGFSWIIKLPKNEYKESITFAVDSIWYAYDGTNVLQQISDALCVEICTVVEKITQIRVDSDVIEALADISTGMRKEYALKILRSLKGKCRSNAKKAYKKALNFWGFDEENL